MSLRLFSLKFNIDNMIKKYFSMRYPDTEIDNMKIRLQVYRSFSQPKISSPSLKFKFYSIFALRL